MNPLSRLFLSRESKLNDARVRFGGAVRSSDRAEIKEIAAAFPELLNACDESGSYPLHWAARAQSLASVACLIDLGANVTQRDRLGYTPEQVASWYGEYRMGAYTDVCQKICERLQRAQSVPNHSPDPAPASGTSPAGQEPRHR